MKFKLVEFQHELEQILELQNANHFDNVSAQLKKEHGFVTVRHDLGLLSKMHLNAAQIVASNDGKVVGYALVMLKTFKALIPVLTPMFDAFEHVTYKNSKLSTFNFYVMGQVCIAKNYRGKGVFKGLYQKHKDIYSNTFDLCITEVSSSNPRSLHAHKNVGFKTAGTFKDSTDEWHILVWDWT